MTRDADRFARSRRPGELVIATSASARVPHLVRLSRSAHEDAVRAIDPELSDADREREIRAIDPHRSALWDGATLCGSVRQGRYYWRPAHLDADRVCAACRRAHRASGAPPIAAPDPDPVDRPTLAPDADLARVAWPWPLPSGWREVPAAGHPWDVASGGDVEAIKDDEGTVVGERRVEIRRWVRGPRIVRLIRIPSGADDEAEGEAEVDEATGGSGRDGALARVHEVRHWWVGAPPRMDERGSRRLSSVVAVARACHALMASGGH